MDRKRRLANRSDGVLMIVPMTEAHIAEVAEIERLCFSEPWSEKALAESLGYDYSHFYVYLEGERAVGYMGLYAICGEGSVTNVAVHPDCRGRGIGAALVRNAVELSGKLGLEYIVLEVRKSNVAAQKLYEKCGFSKVGVRKNFYSMPREDGEVMQLFVCQDK